MHTKCTKLKYSDYNTKYIQLSRLFYIERANSERLAKKDCFYVGKCSIMTQLRKKQSGFQMSALQDDMKNIYLTDRTEDLYDF